MLAPAVSASAPVSARLGTHEGMHKSILSLPLLGRPGNARWTTSATTTPAAWKYAEGVAREVLTRYSGFEWVSFHPPENTQVCRCLYCTRAFVNEVGEDYGHAHAGIVSAFHWRSCLQFQHELEQMAHELVPGARFFSVTIPGTFEQEFAVVAQTIPKTTLLLHWDYWSYGPRIPELLASLKLFRSQGHSVAFAPSSGWSLDKLGENYGDAVREQIRAVHDSGIQDILYFAGAIWHEPSLRATACLAEKRTHA